LVSPRDHNLLPCTTDETYTPEKRRREKGRREGEEEGDGDLCRGGRGGEGRRGKGGARGRYQLTEKKRRGRSLMEGDIPTSRANRTISFVLVTFDSLNRK
jgi:hypothetical protein